MECLYQREHACCINYVHEEKERAIRAIHMVKGSHIYEHPGIGRLVILLKGKISISCSLYEGIPVPSRRMFYLPVGCGITISAQKVSCLVLVRLDHKIHFCDSFRMEQLAACIDSAKPDENILPVPFFLPVTPILESILRQVKTLSDAGYNCRVYFEKKSEELLMMMRSCYTKEQLASFFKEIVNAESHFAYKVVHNYHRFRMVSELAAFMGMAPDTFYRRFRKAFGKSGYKWLTQKRKQDIYHAITTDNESFKELSVRFGFSSPIVFNDYCKRHFKDTPGKIRQRVKNTE